MNKLNFIKADKPYRSNTTDSGKNNCHCKRIYHNYAC